MPVVDVFTIDEMTLGDVSVGVVTRRTALSSSLDDTRLLAQRSFTLDMVAVGWSAYTVPGCKGIDFSRCQSVCNVMFSAH